MQPEAPGGGGCHDQAALTSPGEGVSQARPTTPAQGGGGAAGPDSPHQPRGGAVQPRQPSPASPVAPSSAAPLPDACAHPAQYGHHGGHHFIICEPVTGSCQDGKRKGEAGTDPQPSGFCLLGHGCEQEPGSNSRPALTLIDCPEDCHPDTQALVSTPLGPASSQSPNKKKHPGKEDPGGRLDGEGTDVRSSCTSAGREARPGAGRAPTHHWATPSRASIPVQGPPAHLGQCSRGHSPQPASAAQPAPCGATPLSPADIYLRGCPLRFHCQSQPLPSRAATHPREIRGPWPVPTQSAADSIRGAAARLTVCSRTRP